MEVQATTVDSLNGEFVARWARHCHLNIVWSHETVDDREDLTTIIDLPQRARNRARHQLTAACEGIY